MNATRDVKAMLFGIVATLLSGNAAAALITFTHAGTGSGVIGSTSFTDADFVITAVGDTNNKHASRWALEIEHNIATIEISGLGAFDFLTGTQTFVNNDAEIVGFSRADGSDLFDGPVSPAFATWGLDTSIGPITGSGELLQWNDWLHSPLDTTGGALYFFDSTNASATFQATVVPLPAAMWLFGVGMVGLIGIGSRGHRVRQA